MHDAFGYMRVREMRIHVFILCFVFVVILLSGCSVGSKTQIKLVDKDTQEPITGKTAIVQQIILCKTGGECKPPMIFEGKTDKNGMISVNQDVLKGNVNFLVDGYYVSSLFHATKQTEPHNVYDKYIVNSANVKFDIRTDIITVELQRIGVK